MGRFKPAYVLILSNSRQESTNYRHIVEVRGGDPVSPDGPRA